jgi:general secretion pathway protein A
MERQHTARRPGFAIRRGVHWPATALRGHLPLYEPWYGFREKPFSLTPDPKYLYLSPRHAEAFAHLEFGRRERGGFIVITGEVGTGKTTLARYFLSTLGPETQSAVVLYPALSAAELMRATLDDLHVKPKGPSLKSLVDALHKFLLEARAAGRNVVLLIDEAQDLSAEVLEQIRLLSNLETDTEKLIQIILMGQPELRDLLAQYDLRQLAQRVTARYHLGPLDESETGAYVRHRIGVAGGEGKVGFTRDALAAVHARSGGIPRLVNLICDRALLAGYVRSVRTITAGMVTEAANEIDTPAVARPMRWHHLAVGTFLTATLAVGAFALAPRLAQAPSVGPATLTAEDAAATPGSPPAAPATATAPASSAAFDAFLRTGNTQVSYAQANGRVARAWGEAGATLAQAPLRTHLDQLRAIDLPAALEVFHPSRPGTGWVALLGLGRGSARVFIGPGHEEVVPVSQLEAFWTRNAVVSWPEDPAVVARPGRLDAWARERLAARGYADASLADSVRRFQEAAGLVSDGLLGPRTRMALFALSATDHPSLNLEGLP